MSACRLRRIGQVVRNEEKVCSSIATTATPEDGCAPRTSNRASREDRSSPPNAPSACARNVNATAHAAMAVSVRRRSLVVLVIGGRAG